MSEAHNKTYGGRNPWSMRQQHQGSSGASSSISHGRSTNALQAAAAANLSGAPASTATTNASRIGGTRGMPRAKAVPWPGAAHQTLDGGIKDREAATSEGERLVVRKGRRLIFLQLMSIDFAEAEGNYARLHVDGETHLFRTTMADLAGRLECFGFVRIHRSTIINPARVQEVRPTGMGDYEVILHDGTIKRWSRGYRSELRLLLRPSD